MESEQHEDLITFTLTIQRATLPSVILGNAHVYVSMCVSLHVYSIHTDTTTHTLHSHTNTISYIQNIFQQKI